MYGSLRGGLTHGPPARQTFLARAIAGEMAEFLSLSIVDVLDMWMGVKGETCTKLFGRRRRTVRAIPR
jgi:SpoVK/Ycf46/Vps4 family AAA+-type ATPase